MIASNVSNFLVVWIGALILAAPEFGLFSFCLAAAQLTTVLSFDWLRTAVIRWSSGGPSFMASITKLYAIVSISLVAVAACLLPLGLGPIGLVVAFYSVGQGWFDLLQAHYRTQFEDHALVLTAVARAVFAPIIFLATIQFLPTHTACLASLGATFLLVSALPLRRVVFFALRTREASRGTVALRNALALGATMSVANLLYYGLQTAVRGLAILLLSSTEAAAAMFTLDVVQRVFVALGTTLNLVVLQPGIARIDNEGRSALPKAVGTQIVFGYALLLPALIGFCVVADAFARHMVPEAYRPGFVHFSIYAALSATLTTLKVYSLDSAFVLMGKGNGAVISSALGGITTITIIVVLNYSGWGVLSIWAGLVAGSVVGLWASYLLITGSLEVRLPTGDLLKVTGSALVLLTLYLAPFRENIWFLAAAPITGGVMYVAALYISKAFRSIPVT